MCGSGKRRRERVDRPVHAGGRVEQPAGRGRVEHGWSQRVQCPVADIEGLAVHDPLAPLEREVEAVRVTFHHRPVAHQLRVRARGQCLVEVAGVVDIVVRQEDPPDILRLDEREHVLQPLFAVRGSAGVDDHRLLAEDDHRVDVDEQRLAERRLHLMDHERVVRDPRRRHIRRRRDRRKRHPQPPRSVTDTTSIEAAIMTAHQSGVQLLGRDGAEASDAP